MEPDELFHLERGPEAFSLTTLMIDAKATAESETVPEAVVFKKRREEFHVVYISDRLWTMDRKVIEECDKSGALKPVLKMLGIESFDSSPLCYVLQKDTESGWWIMWLAVKSRGDSESGELHELTLLIPHSRTRASFWMEGVHSFVISDWDSCLDGSNKNLSWAGHANIKTNSTCECA